MMIAAHHSMAGSQRPRLPYDAEVDYIRTDGNEYILTGVVPDSTVRIETQFKWLTINAQARLFGSNSGGSPAKEYSFYRGASYISARGGNTDNTATWVAGTNGTVYTLDYSATAATLNNTQRTIDGAHPAGTFEFALFGRNNIGTVYYSDYKMVCDFYYMKMWLGNTLVRDFIPVRFTNESNQSEGALYDKVSGLLQPFRNQGTGAFVIGPDKVINRGGA